MIVEKLRGSELVGIGVGVRGGICFFELLGASLEIDFRDGVVGWISAGVCGPDFRDFELLGASLDIEFWVAFGVVEDIDFRETEGVAKVVLVDSFSTWGLLATSDAFGVVGCCFWGLLIGVVETPESEFRFSNK